MATKKPAALKTDTAVVAVKKSGAVVDIAKIKAELAAKAAALSNRVAPVSGDQIQITQSKMFKLPDGTETPGPLELVVVDFTTVHAYYEKPFNPKSIVPPNCFAIGQIPLQMVPSNNSPDKQANSCQGCPQNEYGSSPVGEGKACKNTRRLAVLPPDADADTPMWILNVSPTALKSFDAFVATTAAKHNVPPLGVVVTVGFDPSKEYASLRFSEPRPNENMEVAYLRQDEALKRLEQEPDVSTFEKAPAKKAVARR